MITLSLDHFFGLLLGAVALGGLISLALRWVFPPATEAENERLREMVLESANKMEYMGTFIETEDGMFTFPDGDYVVTKRKPYVPRGVAKEPRV